MITRDEISLKLVEYLEELFEIPGDKIVPNALLSDDLDLDSIDAVDLMVKLQELTGRRVKPEEFKTVRTISDVIDCVERLMVTDEHAHP